jgi:RHS repeat-associated protein
MEMFKKFKLLAIGLVVSLLASNLNISAVSAATTTTTTTSTSTAKELVSHQESSKWLEDEKKSIKNKLNTRTTIKNISPTTNNSSTNNQSTYSGSEQRDIAARIMRVQEHENNKILNQINEDATALNIEAVAQDSDTSTDSVQQLLDQGQTLQEVSELLNEEQQNSSVLNKKSKEGSETDLIEDLVKSDIGENIDLSTMNLFRAIVTPPKPEEPKLDMLKLKLDEAPYKIDLETESVSTVSGSLSLTESDFTLPGRNGHSFTLIRSYDSGSAQLYDTDVKSTETTREEYYVQVDFDTAVYIRYYNLTYQYNNIVNEYRCSDGAYLKGISSGYTVPVPFDYATLEARNNAINNLQPSGTYLVKDECSTKGTKQLILKVLMKELSEPLIHEYDSTDVDYLGPYSLSVAQAQVNQFNQSLQGEYYDSVVTSEGEDDRYIASAQLHTETIFDVLYENSLVASKDQARAPLGIGWTWQLPYLTFDNGTYVHLAGGGTHKVENTYLKGHPWKDYTLVADTTVTVDGANSAYVLKSISGQKQYFDSNGRVIQISDAYNNNTLFKYKKVAPYDFLLTEVEDAIGNKLNIQYTTSEITLTSGDRKVIYRKALSNGKEILTEVVDSMNRSTLYKTDIKNAKFNLLGTELLTTNSYALIRKVTYPTGSQTIYEYENNPVKRITGPNSAVESYRLAIRKERLDSSEDPAKEVNKSEFIYTTDMGRSYNQDIDFETVIYKGQVKKTMKYKKDYIDDQTPPMIYNTMIEEDDLITKRITAHEYDEVKRIPNPIKTTKTYQKAGSTSEPVIQQSTYDDYGNVLTTTDPFNQVTTFTYDPVTHLRNTEKWPIKNGGQTEFIQVVLVRNAQGDVEDYSIKDSTNNLLLRTSYTFDIYGNTLTATDYDTSRQAVTKFEYSNQNPYKSGFLTKQTVVYRDTDNVAREAISSSTYDTTTGNMLTFTDERSNKTAYEHDKLDRIKKIINPDLSTFIVDYNDIDNQITTTNETGLKIRSTWDTIGRAVESGVFENGIYKAKTKTGYDALSRIMWEEDPSGNRIAYTYDNWDRKIKETNADNSFSTTSYDDVSNSLIETDEENNQTYKLFDKLGQILEERDKNEQNVFELKEKTKYDVVGNIIETTDALNNTTKYGYDGLAQLTSVTTPIAQDKVVYTYDLLGNMTQLTYANGTSVKNEYDLRGLLVKQTDETSKVKKMYYDEAGNLSRLVDRKNQTINYTYDSKDRLLTRASSNETVVYTYDKDGKRKTMSDGTGLTSYEYYPHSGLTKKKTFPDLRTVEYDYDLRGNRTSLKDPFGRVSVFEYDTVNRLKTVTTDGKLSANYTYYKNDRIDKLTHGNGIVSDYGYTGDDFTSLVDRSAIGTAITTYAYQHDANGNMKTRSENGVSQSYTYDEVGRIKTNSQFNEMYEYDVKGNRKSLTTKRILPLNNKSYTHDSWNHLTQSKMDTQNPVTYVYNGDDQLYERTETGVKKRYYWDDGNLIAEAVVEQAGTKPIASYIYGTGLLERIDAQSLARSTYLLNGHQDVVELRGEDGGLQNKYTYDIWGVPLTAIEEVPNPFRYSSEYWDDTAKLSYLSIRWYDPSIGRFLEEDTFEGELKNPLSLNPYTYAHNDPIAYSDPTGNFAFLIPVAIYVGKAAIKTAVDVYIDKKISKATGTKFNLGKAVLKNGLSNAVPGLGEAKTIGKAVKAGKAIKATRSSAKAKNATKYSGRSGKQARLKEIAQDEKVSSALRGEIKRDINEIKNKKRKNVRVPQGYQMQHRRGFEARKGFGYKYSDLNITRNHKTQHRYDNNGKNRS